MSEDECTRDAARGELVEVTTRQVGGWISGCAFSPRSIRPGRVAEREAMARTRCASRSSGASAGSRRGPAPRREITAAAGPAPSRPQPRTTWRHGPRGSWACVPRGACHLGSRLWRDGRVDALEPSSNARHLRGDPAGPVAAPGLAVELGRLKWCRFWTGPWSQTTIAVSQSVRQVFNEIATTRDRRTLRASRGGPAVARSRRPGSRRSDTGSGRSSDAAPLLEALRQGCGGSLVKGKTSLLELAMATTGRRLPGSRERGGL